MLKTARHGNCRGLSLVGTHLPTMGTSLEAMADLERGAWFKITVVQERV